MSFFCLFCHEGKASFAKGPWVQKNPHTKALSLHAIWVVSFQFPSPCSPDRWWDPGALLSPLHCGLSCTELWQQCWSTFCIDYTCCSENPYQSKNKCRSAGSAGQVRQEVRGWGADALCLPGRRYKQMNRSRRLWLYQVILLWQLCFPRNNWRDARLEPFILRFDLSSLV